jgi:hypothetical protein
MIVIGVEGADQEEEEPSHHHVVPEMSLPHEPSQNQLLRSKRLHAAELSHCARNAYALLVVYKTSLRSRIGMRVVPEYRENAGIGGVGSSAYLRGLEGECSPLGPLRARALAFLEKTNIATASWLLAAGAL